MGNSIFQSLQLLALVKQLQIEDQYEAIIYILSAINTYLKNVFSCDDREIVKTKISSNPDLNRGHVNDVLRVIKADEGQQQQQQQTEVVQTKVGQVARFGQLVQFPYFIRARGCIKLLHKIRNPYVRPFDPERSWSYSEWLNWTAGINQVNKLRRQVKARVVVRKVIVPRPIKRSLSLPAAAGGGKQPKKQQVRSLSTTVRSSATDTDTEGECFVDTSIDYDELILNPELEQKLALAAAANAALQPPTQFNLPPPLPPPFLPKDNPKKIIVLENRVIIPSEKLDDLDDEDDDDDEEAAKPQTSAEVLPAKKPAKKRKTHPCLFCKKRYV